MNLVSVRRFAWKRIWSLICILVLTFCVITPIAAAAKSSNHLKNGTYKVRVDVVKADENRASMSSMYFKKQAKLTVKGSRRTMTVYADADAIHKVKPNGVYQIDLKVKNRKGGYTKAKVSARNSKGSPTAFTFDLPDAGTFEPIQLNPHVAAMGNKYVSARLKISYSTARHS